jgi:hypothetical protein
MSGLVVSRRTPTVSRGGERLKLRTIVRVNDLHDHDRMVSRSIDNLLHQHSRRAGGLARNELTEGVRCTNVSPLIFPESATVGLKKRCPRDSWPTLST